MSAAEQLPVDEPLIKVEEAARLVGVATKTVYKLIEEGTIPGVRRLGRRIRFYKPELVAFMATGQRSVPPRRKKP